jgi:DNA helicase-2/ATP-dependent DNA helicase PcrA
MDLLSDLTPAQKDAVTHLDGPLLILAGAGSGKTRVITRRVAYLMQQGVSPGNILAITFTNKAAGEMRRRVEELVPGSRAWISTFHSLGARLLRRYADHLGLDRNFTIYDQDDRKLIVKAALEEAKIDRVHFTPDRVMAAISRAKNQLHGPEQYAAREGDFFAQTVARVYPLYEKKLRAANALDFDDLLMHVALMLRHHPDIRAELDEHFRYVMIDEYQDTNYAQYVIARDLCRDYPNLCVVGDPDQSIYRFRGSDIRNILNFERDFPNAREITLERNYRSTKVILRSASRLIAHNRKRKPKTLVTENPEGPPVIVRTYATNRDEADGIAREIRQAVESGRRAFHDFAIFIRINALSRGLESALIKHRVPYQIVRGLAFFERKENKDILAYVRLLLNPADDISFLRVINEPARGIGRVTLEHLRMHAEPRGLSLFGAACEVHRIPAIKAKAASALADFAKLITELGQFRDATADEVIRQVIDRSGYRAMLQKSDDPDDQERLANIEELITAAHQFAAENETNDIGAFLEHVTLASDVDAWDDEQDQVSIMTLHTAKGLEFPVVYMVAVEERLLPHERSQFDPEELEEERRLAFVGMTRAKEELYLTHARMREFRGSLLYTIPSPFLDELTVEGVEKQDLTGDARADSGFYPDDDPDDLYAPNRGSTAPAHRWQPRLSAAYEAGRSNDQGMSAGTLVRHATYGLGRVIELSGFGALRKIRVLFASHGEKTFVLSKAPLEVVDPGE